MNRIRRWSACFSLPVLCITVVASACRAETATPRRPPIHRYSFDGEGGPGAQLTDSIGHVHGEIALKTVAQLPYHPGSTTLVVLPDTEGYCLKRPQTFFSMMDWVAKNREKRNIKCVLHVGDITNNNLDAEWKNARKAFDFIENKVPYVLAAGNHDYDHTEGRLTYMNKYFKLEDQKKGSTFGDVYEAGKLENHYQFIEINGQKWMVLSLEMGPRKSVIAWANQVLAKHQDRPAIVLTHGYLCYGTERYDHRRGKQRATPYNFYGDGADGEMMWSQLVSKHHNMMMVVCGHLSSQYVGYRKDKGEHGNLVHQMLVDYENLRGGGGFLRLLEFLPDGKTVQVRTYSPVSNEIRSPITKGDKPLRDASLEEFTFTLQAAPGHEQLLAPSSKQTKAVVDKTDTEVSKGQIQLNGKGQLVIDANDAKGFGKLNADFLKGRKEASFEVWVTPSADKYNWSPVVQFEGGKNLFYYTFRTLTKHRAEMIVNGHNERIQSSVDVKVGQPMHIVVTYDQDGRDGQPLLSSYVNGRPTGQLTTKIKLSELALTRGQIGPFAGTFDELRIYDYPMSSAEVSASFKAGPSRLSVER